MSRTLSVEVSDEAYEVIARHAEQQGQSAEATAAAWVVKGAAEVLRQTTAAAPPADARCSFCGKGRDEIRHMVTGQSVRICAECVRECNRLLRRGQGGGDRVPLEVPEELYQGIRHWARVGGRTPDETAADWLSEALERQAEKARGSSGGNADP